jgi:hypothetical protein
MFFSSYSFERSIFHLFLTINSIKILYFSTDEKHKNNKISDNEHMQFLGFYYLMLIKSLINLELLLPPKLTVINSKNNYDIISKNFFFLFKRYIFAIFIQVNMDPKILETLDFSFILNNCCYKNESDSFLIEKSLEFWQHNFSVSKVRLVKEFSNFYLNYKKKNPLLKFEE